MTLLIALLVAAAFILPAVILCHRQDAHTPTSRYEKAAAILESADRSAPRPTTRPPHTWGCRCESCMAWATRQRL